MAVVCRDVGLTQAGRVEIRTIRCSAMWPREQGYCWRDASVACIDRARPFRLITA
jgi:hypothetical protein